MPLDFSLMSYKYLHVASGEGGGGVGEETMGAYHLTKIRLGCWKHNGKRFTSLRQKCHIRYGLNPKKRANLCSLSLEARRKRELVNGKQHSLWFVPTGMNGLHQNVLLNFRLEFPKSDLTIYLPGISEVFCQMVSTRGRDRETMFSQLAKRSPYVVVSG